MATYRATGSELLVQLCEPATSIYIHTLTQEALC